MGLRSIVGVYILKEKFLNRLPHDFEVIYKRLVVVVFEVHFDFVRENDFIVVLLWVGLLVEEVFFVEVFECGGTGEAGF